MAADDVNAAYEAACAEVKAAGDWSKAIPNERKLISYGLFKQITKGDNNTTAPWAVQFEAKAKWEAWTARKGMGAQEAKALYVAEWEAQKAEFNR